MVGKRGVTQDSLKYLKIRDRSKIGSLRFYATLKFLLALTFKTDIYIYIYTMNHSGSVLVFQQMEKLVLRWEGENYDTETRGQAAKCYRHVSPPYESTYHE